MKKRYLFFLFAAYFTNTILLAQPNEELLKISAGSFHSVALLSDGSIWTWGDNRYNALGESDTIIYAPKRVGDDFDWVDIDAGSDHNLAIKKDGSLWAWGDNSYGQLGFPDSIKSSVPIQIGNSTDWKFIEAAAFQSFAIRTDGSLWAWGLNNIGMLGTGEDPSDVNPEMERQPVMIGDNKDWVKVSSDFQRALALKSDGSLWAWGTNNRGQLGHAQENIINSSTPLRVGEDNDWVDLETGGYQSLGIRKDGSLWAWGATSPSENHILTKIGTENNWVSLSSGTYQVLAIKKDSSLWAWGHNKYGQLGTGDTNDVINPVRIGTEKNWKAISAGYYHTLALKYNYNGYCSTGSISVEEIENRDHTTLRTTFDCIPTSDVVTGTTEKNFTTKTYTYPNPSDGRFILLSDQETEVSIFDSKGSQIHLEKLDFSNNYTAQVNIYNVGMYVIYYHSNNYFEKHIVVK